MATNVPTITFTDAGFVAPQESAVLAGVIADIQAAFGGTLSFDNLKTPQGQLATTFTSIIVNSNAVMVNLLNQYDPSFASGRAQDAIGEYYFITRIPASATTVTAACSGQAGVIIPSGALAKDLSGNIYASTSAATIGSGGTVDVEFQCQVTGAVSCPANSLTVIYTAINGWDSINNSASGAIGSDAETRDAFEARRIATVAGNSNGALQSVKAAILAVDNVVDAFVIENKTDSSSVINGVTLSPHSIYCSVYGGDATAIATAIASKKGPGCNTVGNTSVTITPDTSYSPPYPSYVFNYEVPTATDILFSVTIANSSSVPSTALTEIQDAIVSAFNGNTTGYTRERIAGTIYAGKYYSVIASLGPWAQVISINIGIGTADALSVTLNADQIPVCSSSNITMVLV